MSPATLGMRAAGMPALRMPPGMGGFEPRWFRLILAARVFGPGFGVVVGAVCSAASALLTGGVGPWLPYRMPGRGQGWPGGRLASWRARASRDAGAWRVRTRGGNRLRHGDESMALAVRNRVDQRPVLRAMRKASRTARFVSAVGDGEAGESRS